MNDELDIIVIIMTAVQMTVSYHYFVLYTHFFLL